MLLSDMSLMLVKDHRFKVFVGNETHLFVVEELVTGLAAWPSKFRLKLHASPRSEAKTFYGASCHEVAEKVADYIARNSGHAGVPRTSHSSQSPPFSPHQMQQSIQMSDSESD
jgi:hypothetical protein